MTADEIDDVSFASLMMHEILELLMRMLMLMLMLMPMMMMLAMVMGLSDVP